MNAYVYLAIAICAEVIGREVQLPRLSHRLLWVVMHNGHCNASRGRSKNEHAHF